MDLSIIIVSYNVKKFIIDCLTSIYENIDASILVEVIVIDNNSIDGSIEAINEKFPQVQVIKNNYNAGFPAANNQGFKIAKGDYIFMLNPDTEIIGDAIQGLLYYLKSNTDVSIIGPKLLNSDKSLQQSFWRFPSIKHIFAESFYLKFLLSDKLYKEANVNCIFEVDSVSGAALMFRRKLMDTLGILDENLFWIEDVDFCFRAKQNKEKIIYFPNVQIIHHSGKSVKSNYNVAYYNKIFNNIKYFKKHHSTFQFILVWLICLFQVIYKVILFWTLSPIYKTSYYKAKAYSYTLKYFFK